MRLSQHYIGPKMKFCHILNICRKKFPGLTKEFFPLIEWIYRVATWCFQITTSKVGQKCEGTFLWSQETFSAESWMTECHFWTNVMLRQPHVQASRASPAQKSKGLKVVYSKNFSRATLFVFWGTPLVDRYLSYLPDETNMGKKCSVSLVISDFDP